MAVGNVIFILFLCIGKISCSAIEVNLAGIWTIQNANKNISVHGEVPGNVHTALYRNGTIKDPYFRFNDVEYRWIAYDNWTYSRAVEVSEVLLSKRQILLVFEGLDTVATILVNGIEVGHSKNMFHRYIFNVKGVLKTGLNIIEVRFTSAVFYANEQAKKSPYRVPPECTVTVQRGECHGNFIRKEQCSFSWGLKKLRVHSFGMIWIKISDTTDPRSLRPWCIKESDKSLSTVDSAAPLMHPVDSSDLGSSLLIRVIPKEHTLSLLLAPGERELPYKGVEVGSVNVTWQLSVTAFLDAAYDGVIGSIHLRLPQMSHYKELRVKLSQGLQRVSLPVMSFTEKDDIKPWWPQGYGKPNLYAVEVVFIDASGEEQSSTHRNIGFRKVNLVQEPIKGAPGLGFHFEINDLPIFLKGANWIPADAFEDRVTSSVLRNLLQSAADANMNVVRNWGGGIYQHDEFYNIADELGLLVWEEFMFACAMYPTDEEFLNSVKEEVRYQVRRLHHHPSLMVWSGNNENEAALAENWYNTSPEFSRYAKDYVKLYIDTIRETLEEEDKSRPFLSSSPSNGVDTEKEGWVAKKPSSPYWGDVHFYDYKMDCWSVSGYPKPRFASEYGFQSYPSFETLAEVSVPGDWTYNSTFMDHRQHHAIGNKEMLDQAAMHFKLPSSSVSLKKFKDTLFLTQVTQAQCMKIETEHYRRLQSELVQGKGRTMGTIYWQLNSIWQAPTWSSLEYGGRWKMLHYFVKDFYAPVIASSYVEGDKFKLYVVSDLTKPITRGAVSLKAWAWSSFKPLHSRIVTFQIDRQSSKLIYADDLEALVKTSGCESPRHCVFTMAPTDQSTGEVLGPTNVFFPANLSDAVGLQDPQLKVSKVFRMSNTEFGVSILAQSPACFVWLVSKDVRGRFSENGFLLTEPSKKVIFYSWQDTTEDYLENSLYIMSLYDLYT